MSKFSEITEYELGKIPFRGRGLKDFKRKVEDPLPYIEGMKKTPLKILEIGCGFGQLLIDLSYQSKKDLLLYGISKNSGDVGLKRALKISKFKNIIPEKFTSSVKNVHFLCFDVGKGFPFPNHSFDIILSQVCIAYIPEKLFLITEIKRLLTPDGIALLHVEFENYSDQGILNKNLETLQIMDRRKNTIDLDKYFNQYTGFTYSKKKTGSVLKIQGGGNVEFNAEYITSKEFPENSQHGVQSIYELKK